MKKLCLLFVLVSMLLQAGPMQAQDMLAFPGADGYGKYTTGGRGGEVCYVTRTDDCSDNDLVEGTLRWALRHDNGGKPRTVLFATSGTIYLTSKLKLQYPDVSILGAAILRKMFGSRRRHHHHGLPDVHLPRQRNHTLHTFPRRRHTQREPYRPRHGELRQRDNRPLFDDMVYGRVPHGLRHRLHHRAVVHHRRGSLQL